MPVYAAAIGFSRKALRLMRQNLWLAAGYNLLAVPLAIAKEPDHPPRSVGALAHHPFRDAKRWS